MEPNVEQLAQLKQIELEILKQFIVVCEQLNLKYYLVEGTLLGAARHKGFIPWDDDIDVAMPRKDYEKFLEVAQDHLSKPYFVQTFKTDPAFPSNFAKIRNSNTAFVESSAAHLKMNHGVYIDIFPLDYYPSKNIKLFKLKKEFYSFCISTAFKSDAKRSVRGRFLKSFCKLFCPSLMRIVQKKEELLSATTSGDKLTNHCSAWGDREIVPAEWYGEGTKLQFEGIEVNVPSEYDKVLTSVYGDYMQVPPIEKRVAHHYIDVIDFEKSYTNYIN